MKKINSNDHIDISIVIVNYNTEEHLKSCLESIFSVTANLDFEVIVIDNNSPSKEIHKFRDIFPKVKFIFNNENLGFGAGCNIGFTESKGKYIAFVNPDILFSNNCLYNIIEYFESHDDVGFCSGLLTDEKDVLIYSYNNFPGVYWEYLESRGRGTGNRIQKILNRKEVRATLQPFNVDWLIGAFLVTSSEFLRAIKGFDDKIFFLYYEDVDIQLRAKRFGKRNVCIPTLQLKHYERSSVRSFDGENFYYLHMHRSKMLYYYKNGSFFKRNIIRLLHIWGFSSRFLYLPFRKKFRNKKTQKIYQYLMLMKIYFSRKSQLLRLHNVPQNFILEYIKKKGLDKFVLDEYWEKA